MTISSVAFIPFENGTSPPQDPNCTRLSFAADSAESLLFQFDRN